MYSTNAMPITVPGRQGMEKVDFLEKTTVARDLGHELFIYGLNVLMIVQAFSKSGRAHYILVILYFNISRLGA